MISKTFSIQYTYIDVQRMNPAVKNQIMLIPEIVHIQVIDKT